MDSSDSRTFDGFRKTMVREFNEIHIVDLGGDVRANPKLSGTTHNVFGIQTGVAISFWVKKHKQKGCKIFYARRPEMETASDKLTWLGESELTSVPFDHVTPDDKGNWINLADNDFDSLLPLGSKATKAAITAGKEKALFKLYSLGISTNRDDWVYDDSRDTLAQKMQFFVERYEEQKSGKEFDDSIKWSEALKIRFEQGRHEKFSYDLIRPSLYRPYCIKQLYDSGVFIDRLGAKDTTFPVRGNNIAICLLSGERQPFSLLASANLPNLNLYSADPTQYLSLFRYDDAGNRVDNITDWGLKQFVKHYSTVIPAQAGIQSNQKSPKGQKTKSLDSRLRGNDDGAGGITKESIFHYVYAVLHHPAYREKYALNLKREFPRIPFYDDFAQWAAWGKQLMELHVGFEGVQGFELERVEKPLPHPSPLPLGEGTKTARERSKAEGEGAIPKAKLKADKEQGCIVLDEATTLRGIPPEAWDYKLGNRSALEWVLDQYKETAPRDPTIREKFNTYRFADYKEQVIDLLRRVTTVSVKTQHIVAAMP